MRCIRTIHELAVSIQRIKYLESIRADADGLYHKIRALHEVFGEDNGFVELDGALDNLEELRLNIAGLQGAIEYWADEDLVEYHRQRFPGPHSPRHRRRSRHDDLLA